MNIGKMVVLFSALYVISVSANERDAFAELEKEFEPKVEVVKEREIIERVIYVEKPSAAVKAADAIAVSSDKLAEQPAGQSLINKNFNNGVLDINLMGAHASQDKHNITLHLAVENIQSKNIWLDYYYKRRYVALTDSSANRWVLSQYKNYSSEVQITPGSVSRIQLIFELENPPQAGEADFSSFKEPLYFSSVMRYKHNKQRERFNLGFDEIYLK